MSFLYDSCMVRSMNLVHDSDGEAMSATPRDVLATTLAELNRLSDSLASALEAIDLQVPAIQVTGQGRWTREQVAGLWPQVNHLPGVRALFEITAAHQGVAVTFTELVMWSGLGEMQQRNEHSRLTRIANDLYGQGWPIEYWQGSRVAATGKAETRYRMGETVAAWWRSIR